VFLPLTLFGAPGASRAQQAIINLPSADITPKGRHFYMHETQARTIAPGTYWYGTNFYAYGVGKSTELAVTSYSKGTPLPGNFATGVGFKSAPKLFAESQPELDLKLTMGQMMVLNHRGAGIGSLSYAHLSFRLPDVRTRITAGGFAGTHHLLARNTGNLLLGVEHPYKNLIFLAEWMRGRHDFGAFIPGVLIHVGKHQMVVVGFKIPNSAEFGKPGIVLEWGTTF
jgi:hypothetical protein